MEAIRIRIRYWIIAAPTQRSLFVFPFAISGITDMFLFTEIIKLNVLHIKNKTLIIGIQSVARGYS